jgi:hypothetical protein
MNSPSAKANRSMQKEHVMSEKLKPVPSFANEAEERQFWENHDSTDYVDWSIAAKPVRLPSLKPTDRAFTPRLSLGNTGG